MQQQLANILILNHNCLASKLFDCRRPQNSFAPVFLFNQETKASVSYTFFQRLQRFVTVDSKPYDFIPDAGGYAADAGQLTSFIDAAPMPAAIVAEVPDENLLATNLLYFRNTGTDAAPVLAWATSEEPMSACFNLQRSNDGLTWASVHLTAAIGLRGKGASYSAPQKVNRGTKVYFRIRQTLLDGTVTESEVLLVEAAVVATSGRISVTANPVGDMLQLNLPDAQPAALKLRSPQGVTVLQAAAQGASAVMDLKAIPRGVYFLTVMQAGIEEVLRVVKE